MKKQMISKILIAAVVCFIITIAYCAKANSDALSAAASQSVSTRYTEVVDTDVLH